MVLKGAGLQSRCFPSRAYLVETRKGLYLWDTGYAERFRSATSVGVFRLYAWVTPIYFSQQESLLAQLQHIGVRASDIDTLVLSHFHADHVAGMRDFPQARLLGSATGWDAVRKLRGFAAVQQAFVPDLIPTDVEARMQFIEGMPEIDLPSELAPFTRGWDITGDREFIVVNLPGHVRGHIGAFVQTDAGWTLLASDAAWVADNYAQLRGPSELTFLIQHDRRAYYDTLRKLNVLHHSGNAAIRITHDDVNDYVQVPT
jgi:glyoxylase-like metal-dependent hydrolase (beta-lactamase superfamily II)